MAAEARVLLDSRAPNGARLTTMECKFHRFVLAEFNTHRMLSRNSASSRAIPVKKQLQRIKDDLAYPVKWPAEQPGMQGGDEIAKIQAARDVWLSASHAAVEHAIELVDLGVHKSVVNRLLEPFMWHTVIVSFTSWENFARQRAHWMAQPEIHELSQKMVYEYETSVPEPLGLGEWHLPYIRSEEWFLLEEGQLSLEQLKQISVARCARVSYLTHEGERDIAKDLVLYARLAEQPGMMTAPIDEADPMHASPLEHVATPCRCPTIVLDHLEDWLPHVDETAIIGHRGNFRGWDQMRHEVEDRIGWDSYR